MDIRKELAMAVVARAHKRNGTTPPPELTANPPQVKKTPMQTGADPKQSSQAKNAAAAAIAARLGGGAAKESPASPAAGNGNSASLDKFRKMIKMGVPAGAVRGKMAAEGIPSKLIEEVLSGGGGGGSAGRGGPPPPQSQKAGGGSSVLSPSDETIASQYRKMMKIGLPVGAVRHKMMSDEVPQHIQTSVIAGEVSGGGTSSSRTTGGPPGRSAPSGGPVSKLSPEEENVAGKYRKMMKMGLPEGAMRHKMNSDGVPQHIQDSVLANETPASSGGSVSAGHTPSGGGGPISKLSPAEEQIATQYRKMVKMGLPDGAVIHKMAMNDVPKHVQDSVIAREVPATPVESSSPGLSIGSASAFALGAASLKSAPKKQSSTASSSNAAPVGGSPLAIAAAAAAARRANEPKKAPRQVAQNPIPQKVETSGLGALAAAAAARRAKRQGDNPTEQFNTKSFSHKVNEEPKQMFALKPRTSPANPVPKSTPTPRPRAEPSPIGPTRRGPSPAKGPSPASVPIPSTVGPSLPRTPAPATPTRGPAPTPTQRGPSPARSPPTVSLPPVAATPQPVSRSSLQPETATPSAPPVTVTPEQKMAVSSLSLPTTQVSNVELFPDKEPPRSVAIENSVAAASTHPTAQILVGELTADEEEAASTHPTPQVLVGELTADEEEVADHYCGLVRGGRSLESVQEEMVHDGAPRHIQDAVSANFALPLPPPSIPSVTPVLEIAPLYDMQVQDEIESSEPEAVVTTPIDTDPAVHPIEVVTPPRKEKILLDETQFKKAPEEPKYDSPIEQVVEPMFEMAKEITDEPFHDEPVYEPEESTYERPMEALMEPTYDKLKEGMTEEEHKELLEGQAELQYEMIVANSVEPSYEQPKQVPTVAKDQRPMEKAVEPTNDKPKVKVSEGKHETLADEPAPMHINKKDEEAKKNKKKKKRKKTSKGTTILDSGAEQHCACVIM